MPGEIFQPAGYRDPGWKNRHLGNRASPPGLSYEHVDIFSMDLAVCRGLASWASPINRAQIYEQALSAVLVSRASCVHRWLKLCWKENWGQIEYIYSIFIAELISLPYPYNPFRKTHWQSIQVRCYRHFRNFYPYLSYSNIDTVRDLSLQWCKKSILLNWFFLCCALR